MKIIFSLLSAFLFFIPFTLKAQVGQRDIDAFLNDSAVRTGHAGISIYEPATGKYLYNYNADKNFIPSSNVKLFTLYAGMKYLGDSLVGAQILEEGDSIFIKPTGDPTFLHNDFNSQKLFNLLLTKKKIVLVNKQEINPYGNGWSWDDYEEDFMAERSTFPIFGNVITFNKEKEQFEIVPRAGMDSRGVEFTHAPRRPTFKIRRFRDNNQFYTSLSKEIFKTQKIPFTQTGTNRQIILKLLADTLNLYENNIYEDRYLLKSFIKFYSQPTDSLFRPMMFESDNFFAEQTLLMVSNERLGYMGDEQIIDTILKNDLKDIPNKPRWVDGSGLSRYNLFSPKAFVYILDKMQKEFGLERVKRILPTAGQGTLTNYYDDAAGHIYAKTGSMSNNVALSGYLYTRKNKMLLFSVLLNNYTGSGREGRRAIEKLIRRIRETN